MKAKDKSAILANGNFSAILKCMLSKKRMNQNELSIATGLSKATITHYATGRNMPSHVNLEKIANALNVPMQLFYDDATKYTQYLNSVENHFSSYLYSLMKESGLNQDQLSKKIGVSRQSVNYYLNGKMFPKHDIMEKLASLFDVPIDSFCKPPENEKMKIYVSTMPSTKEDCIFYANDNTCLFGGQCNLSSFSCNYITTNTFKE